MREIDFCELSVEQEEYLIELLCSRGACTLDLFARELDALCRQSVRPLKALAGSRSPPPAWRR